jgi:hypothetical protein
VKIASPSGEVPFLFFFEIKMKEIMQYSMNVAAAIAILGAGLPAVTIGTVLYLVNSKYKNGY